jgi:hypothetical protein
MLSHMTRTRYNVWLDDDLIAALKGVQERDGVPPAEQIRRAIRQWLEARDAFPKKSTRSRAATRKRA